MTTCHYVISKWEDSSEVLWPSGHTASNEELATGSRLGCFGLHVTSCSDSGLNVRGTCLLYPETRRRKKVRLRHDTTELKDVIKDYLPSISLVFNRFFSKADSPCDQNMVTTRVQRQQKTVYSCASFFLMFIYFERWGEGQRDPKQGLCC